MSLKISCATEAELLAMLKRTSYTAYYISLIRDELRSRILLTRKYSGTI